MQTQRAQRRKRTQREILDEFSLCVLSGSAVSALSSSGGHARVRRVLDPAPAEEHVAVETNHGLAGCDRALGLIEGDSQLILTAVRDLRRLRRMVVANFRRATSPIAECNRGPSKLICVAMSGRFINALFSPTTTRLLCGSMSTTYTGWPQGHAHALALADREMLMPRRAADDLAGGIEKFAGAEGFGAAPADQPAYPGSGRSRFPANPAC